MKKAISILVLAVLIAGTMSVTAFAHCGNSGNGGRMLQQSQYALCTVDGCDLLGQHQHDGAWYCGQTGLQGNYEVCTVAGCTQLGLHEHDGTYYYCANRGTGRGCGRWQNQ